MQAAFQQQQQQQNTPRTGLGQRPVFGMGQRPLMPQQQQMSFSRGRQQKKEFLTPQDVHQFAAMQHRRDATKQRRAAITNASGNTAKNMTNTTNLANTAANITNPSDTIHPTNAPSSSSSSSGTTFLSANGAKNGIKSAIGRRVPPRKSASKTPVKHTPETCPCAFHVAQREKRNTALASETNNNIANTVSVPVNINIAEPAAKTETKPVNHNALSIPSMKSENMQNAKSEPMMTKNAKREPMMFENAKREPMMTENAKSEPMMTENAKSEPMMTENAKREPMMAASLEGMASGLRQRIADNVFGGVAWFADSESIALSDVPNFHIERPGYYLLDSNMALEGAQCITISSSNVVLDLNNKTIDAKGCETTPIVICASSAAAAAAAPSLNVTTRVKTPTTTTVNATTARVDGKQQATLLENVMIANGFITHANHNAIVAEKHATKNVTMRDLTLQNFRGAAIVVRGCDGLLIDKVCAQSGSCNVGVALHRCENVVLSQLHLDVESSALASVEGMRVETCRNVAIGPRVRVHRAIGDESVTGVVITQNSQNVLLDGVRVVSAVSVGNAATGIAIDDHSHQIEMTRVRVDFVESGTHRDDERTTTRDTLADVSGATMRRADEKPSQATGVYLESTCSLVAGSIERVTVRTIQADVAHRIVLDGEVGKVCADDVEEEEALEDADELPEEEEEEEEME